MKFTYPQKKWVLTTALLAVLGVNVSFNSHSDGVASADFASTSGDLMESKVYTADGVMPVKYIDNGDEEVLALVPKKTTEGKICEGKCGYDTITLSVKNKSDIDSLNVELMKQLAKESATAKKKVVKKEEVEEEDAVEATEEVAAKKKVDYFARIRKDCSSNKEAAAKLACLSPKFSELLNDEKKEISAAESSQFFTSDIQPLMMKQLSAVRSGLGIQLRVQQGLISFDDHFSYQMAIDDAQVAKEETLALTKELISSIPKEHEVVRQKLLSAQTNLLKYEAAQAAELNKMADKTSNIAEQTYLKSEATVRVGEANALALLLLHNNGDGLSLAKISDKITPLQEISYQNYLSEAFTAFINAGKGLPQNSPMNPGIDLSNRLKTPGRGASIGVIPGMTPVQNSQIGVIPQQGTTTAPTATNPVSSRTGATTLSAPLTTSGGGVSFGTPREATAEALQMRQQIRGRQ